jgi:hypothetical protein
MYFLATWRFDAIAMVVTVISRSWLNTHIHKSRESSGYIGWGEWFLIDCAFNHCKPDYRPLLQVQAMIRAKHVQNWKPKTIGSLATHSSLQNRKALPVFSLCIFGSLCYPKISLIACQSNFHGPDSTCQPGRGTSTCSELPTRLFLNLNLNFFFNFYKLLINFL